MQKAKNGIRHPKSVKEQARFLRAEGKTHREIATVLEISIGSAHGWTKAIVLNTDQMKAIQHRRRQHEWTESDRAMVKKRLKSFQYKKRYSSESLLQKIRDFHQTNGRIPLKTEFNAWRLYAIHFGSWNKAIKAAGYSTNSALYSKKCIANDGHTCDSFSEKVIDDWLSEQGIPHDRNVRYGNTRYTADFGLRPGLVLEFFGLAGVEKNYDDRRGKKLLFAKKFGYKVIEVYPNDMFPINTLGKIFHNADL